MKPWAAWALGAGMVAAAWGVALVTPGPAEIQAPFVISVDQGEAGVGRNIAITVESAHRSDRATDGAWSADGNWLVLDLSAAAVVSEQAALLNHVELEIDGRTFRASERPQSLLGTPLSVGVPRLGSVAFELPADLDHGAGIVRFALNPDTRVDSVIEFPVEIGALEPEDEATLLSTGWANP